MAAPLLLLPLDGSLAYQDGGAGGTAVGVGALRWVEGPTFGAEAALVEEGTTNLAQNPSFEANAAGVGIAGSGVTLTRDTGQASVGTASLKVVTPGGAAGQGAGVFSAGPLNYTGSARTFVSHADVKGTVSVNVRTRVIYTDASNEFSSSTIVTLGGSWQRVTTTPVTTNPAKTVNSVSIRIETTAAVATTFYVDAVQVEEKAYATSYADGSMGPGYAWTGTAHNSASTRAATEVTFPRTALNLGAGQSFTIAGRVRPLRAIDGTTLFAAGHLSGNWPGMPSIFIGGGGTELVFILTQSDGGWKFVVMPGMTAATWYTFVWTYDHTTRTARVWVNGTLLGSVTLSGGYSWPVDAAVGDAALFGSAEWSSLFTFADVLTPEQAHALSVTPAWTWDQFAPPPVYVPPAPPVVAILSPQDALNARRTNTWSMVLVDGVSVPAVSWDAQFGVNQASSAARFTVPLPQPANIQPNATVEIIGGHNDYVGTLFAGRIPAWRAAMTGRGNLLTVRAVGWSSLLTYRERFELSYDGPVSIAAIFDSLCARRGVPSYAADLVTDDTGAIEILLGGNPQVDEGKVRIPASQPPLSWLNNAVEPFGFRVYDILGGTVRLTRVSGLPTGEPAARFVEGVHLAGAESLYDISGIVNYPDIIGPTYVDEFGGSVPVRAFPSPIPSNPLIPVNDGVNYQEIRSPLLVSQQLAEIALRVAQVDRAAPDTPVRWDAIGTPGIDPGTVVEVDSPTVSATRRYWLVGIDLNAPEGGGLEATYEGWIGAGEAAPPGNNRQLILIQTGVTHLGDETLAHYAVPAPNGNVSRKRQRWTITIPERATAVNVRFWHHGTNSQLIGGVQTELEVTQFKVYEAGANPDDKDVRAITSGKLDILSEDLNRRHPYSRFTVTNGVVTDPGYWKPGAVNLSRLDAGTYDLYLDAGEKSGADDFEVRYLWLEIFGVAEPVVQPQEVA